MLKYICENIFIFISNKKASINKYIHAKIFKKNYKYIYTKIKIGKSKKNDRIWKFNFE